MLAQALEAEVADYVARHQESVTRTAAPRWSVTGRRVLITVPRFTSFDPTSKISHEFESKCLSAQVHTVVLGHLDT